MHFPTLTAPAVTRQTVDVFGGYRHSLRIRDGEFYHMENLTSDRYPLLAPRGKRGLLVKGNCRGLIVKDTLCRVEGANFVVGEFHYPMGLSSGIKTLVSMGAYVIILPDKKYINTARPTEWGYIDASFTTTEPVAMTLCDEEGKAYDIAFTQAEPPGEPGHLQYWMDTSTQPHSLKQYSESTGMWVPVSSTYVRMDSTGIGAAFEQYDGVTLSGLKGKELIDHKTGQVISDPQVEALEGTNVLWKKGTHYVVLTGLLDVPRTLTNKITLRRKMPNVDFVVEAGNRLFGCRYGTDASGKVVNEIYASKLGDFKNWHCYMGISTDSYSASLGSDGRFTGAVTHLGYPLFFKEHCLHKVYGRQPSDFRIQETRCRGVEKGSEKSLAIVGETLYYKSADGVCAYDGSLPRDISEPLGRKPYKNGVGGSWGSKYYLSAEDPEGGRHLLVYDTARGLWHRESGLAVEAFCSHGRELYALEKDTGRVLTLGGSGLPLETKVFWEAETGQLETTTPDHKYLSRLNLQMQLSPGSRVTVSVSYDSDGVWEQVGAVTGTGLRSFSLPIRPRRCSHLRLRLSGEGPMALYSMSKTMEQGSDLP